MGWGSRRRPARRRRATQRSETPYEGRGCARPETLGKSAACAWALPQGRAAFALTAPPPREVGVGRGHRGPLGYLPLDGVPGRAPTSPVTEGGDHELVLTPPAPARRARSDRRREAVTAAAIDLLTTALVEQPRRIGKPLREELTGRWSARRGICRASTASATSARGGRDPYRAPSSRVQIRVTPTSRPGSSVAYVAGMASRFADWEEDHRRREAKVVAALASEGDLPAVIELADAHSGVAGSWACWLAHDLSEHGRALFVAGVDGTPAGYGRVRYFSPPELSPANTAPAGWYLGGLVVAPVWRDRGAGAALTLARVEWVAGRADEVWYYANAANTVSIALHTAVGFEEVTRDFAVPGLSFKGGVGVLYRMRLGAEHRPGGRPSVQR